MKDIHVAAFIGTGIQDIVLRLSDIKATAKAIDADFDGFGVPGDRVSRTAKIADRIKCLKNGAQRGDFTEIACSLAYAYDKRHGDLRDKYGLVALLVTDKYIDNMHVVGCRTETEHTALINSMQQIVNGLFSQDSVSQAGASLTTTESTPHALPDEAAQHGSLIDALPATLALLAPDGTIVSVNAAWRRFAADNGLNDPNALVGQNYLAVCDATAAAGLVDGAEAAEAVAAGLRAVLAGRREMFALDYPCHSPTEQRWFRLMATPTDTEAGRGVVVMHINITALRRTEMALHEAEKMKAVGQLANGYAHDVRNFLCVVAGQLDLLSKRLGETPAQHNIEMALMAVERVTGLTDRMLAAARPKPHDWETVDPNAVIEGMAELLQQTAGPGVELHLQLTPDIGCVRIPPDGLESALLTLVGSARDAMKPGGRLAIETRYAVSAGQAFGAATELRPLGEHVQIVVRNTGTWIPSGVTALVSEPFSASPAAGTGIDLAQVYSLVRQAGGEVAIESTAGEGSALTIRLPRIRAVADVVANVA